MKFVIICLNLFSLAFGSSTNEPNSLTPLAIISNSIQLVSYDPVFEIGMPEKDNITMVNNGFAIEMFLQKSSSWYIKDGFLNENVFKLYKMRIHWNGSYQDRCCHTVDGKGAALEIILCFYNPECGNFNEALENPDCTVTIHVPTYVESQVGNSKFNIFNSAFQNVLKPGSKYTTSSNIMDWALPFRNHQNFEFYIYNGSYAETFPYLKYFRNTIVMCLSRNRYPRISINQFLDTFGSAISGFKGPLAYSFPSFDPITNISAINVIKFVNT